MNYDDLLRDYARQDLQRFCPAAHYRNRDHNPIVDRELIKPLLREPVRFGLTPRERVAATALGDLTTYEITSRAIWDKANPARDIDDPTPTTGTTFNQEREIWGRREVARCSALVYARMLGDVQLIEHYQTPVKAPAADDHDETLAAREAVERSITKKQVIDAFEGLHFNSRAGWSNALSDVPQWIEPCRVTLGRKGDNSISATWNPVLIAAALIDNGITVKQLDHVFLHSLKDWAGEWEEASAYYR